MEGFLITIFIWKNQLSYNPDMWKIVNGYIDIRNEINIVNAYKGIIVKRT